MQGSTIKKRGRWYIYYYIGKDENGKWKRKWEGSWDTEREAQKVLRSRIDDLESTFERKADSSTMAVYLRHWLDTYCTAHLAPNTVRGYRVNIEKHIIPYIGSIPMNKLQPKDIQKLYDKLLSSGLSRTSVRYVHNNLHKALGAAVKAQLIPRNPAELVDPPTVDHFEAHALSPSQAVALVAACEGQEVYLPVLLALTLGLRRGEALGLLWEDVDLGAKTVTIRRSASFTKEGIVLGATKTKNSRRSLIIPEVLYVALLQAKEDQDQRVKELGAGFNALGLVCCRADGQPFTGNALFHQFHDLLEAQELPLIRFHDLRHTNATLMLRNAIPAKIVSSMLGHSSIGITLDTYSHVITEMQTGAVGVMDTLFGGQAAANS